MFKGKIEEIPGPNPYSFSNRLMKEIETGKEPPREHIKRKVSTSDEAVETEEKELGGKECGTTAQGETAMKPGGTSNEKKKEVPKKGQGKENQARGRDGLNNENVSPNLYSATKFPGVSADRLPPSQRNTFQHRGAAQDLGPGNQGGNMFHTTSPEPSGLWNRWNNPPQEPSGLWNRWNNPPQAPSGLWNRWNNPPQEPSGLRNHWDNSPQPGSGKGRVTSMSSSSSQM